MTSPNACVPSRVFRDDRGVQKFGRQIRRGPIATGSPAHLAGELWVNMDTLEVQDWGHHPDGDGAGQRLSAQVWKEQAQVDQTA